MLKRLAVAASLLTPTIGLCAEPHPYAAFCRSPRLEISPAGNYLVALLPDEISMASLDCVLAGGVCPVARFAGERGTVTTGRMYFSADDRSLYRPVARFDTAGRESGQGEIRMYDTSAIWAGGRTPVATFDFAGRRNMLGYIDVALPLKAADDPATKAQSARASAILLAAEAELTQMSANARNIYGRIDGDRAIWLARKDEDYSVWVSRDGAPLRPLWPNGHPFSPRTKNLRFKFDGRDAMVEASGGVLRISDAGLRDLTAGQSRAMLIDGDDPSTYYGYVSAEGAQGKGLGTRLSKQLNESMHAHSAAAVLGVSVNIASGSSVVSYAPYLMEGQNFARHDVRRGDRRIEIDCGGAPLAERTVKRLGGADGLFIESYARDGARPTVVFLYGGPGGHIDPATRAKNSVQALLDAGFNVDVVHYGGSDYTFALHDRLYRQGAKSLAADARILSRHIEARRAEGRRLYLVMESFGAYFHRRLDAEALAMVDHVLLVQPAGTMDPTSVDAPGLPARQRADFVRLARTSNAALWGPGTATEETEYFKRLKGCPLVQPTTIVVGSRDDVVRPLEDYAPCLREADVEVVTYDLQHGSVLSLQTPDVVRRLVEGR
ncbi:hypothetical protein [Caulobacter hibisci]|uniref:Uncharacterized protein n=1 Tax=Caulobacter hibisci TaxID=2035993 RepID=A0ABS0T6D2_9CAUL|nr:hypothetical protein [Caulobacter hibisci]MBI1686422.1 hypothetical protein [Caulobacter hibisci]